MNAAIWARVLLLSGTVVVAAAPPGDSLGEQPLDPGCIRRRAGHVTENAGARRRREVRAVLAFEEEDRHLIATDGIGRAEVAAAASARDALRGELVHPDREIRAARHVREYLHAGRGRVADAVFRFEDEHGHLLTGHVVAGAVIAASDAGRDLPRHEPGYGIVEEAAVRNVAEPGDVGVVERAAEPARVRHGDVVHLTGGERRADEADQGGRLHRHRDRVPADGHGGRWIELLAREALQLTIAGASQAGIKLKSDAPRQLRRVPVRVGRGRRYGVAGLDRRRQEGVDDGVARSVRGHLRRSQIDLGLGQVARAVATPWIRVEVEIEDGRCQAVERADDARSSALGYGRREDRVVLALVGAVIAVAQVVGVRSAGRRREMEIDPHGHSAGAHAPHAVAIDAIAADRVLGLAVHDDADPSIVRDDVALARPDPADGEAARAHDDADAPVAERFRAGGIRAHEVALEEGVVVEHEAIEKAADHVALAGAVAADRRSLVDEDADFAALDGGLVRSADADRVALDHAEGRAHVDSAVDPGDDVAGVGVRTSDRLCAAVAAAPDTRDSRDDGTQGALPRDVGADEVALDDDGAEAAHVDGRAERG